MKWTNLFRRKIRLNSQLPPHPEQNRFYPLSTSQGEMMGIYAHEGWVFFKNRCPHAGGTFSESLGSENELVCSLHRFRYSLKDGKGAPGQGDFLHIYRLSGSNELVEKGA